MIWYLWFWSFRGSRLGLPWAQRSGIMVPASRQNKTKQFSPVPSLKNTIANAFFFSEFSNIILYIWYRINEKRFQQRLLCVSCFLFFLSISANIQLTKQQTDVIIDAILACLYTYNIIDHYNFSKVSTTSSFVSVHWLT